MEASSTSYEYQVSLRITHPTLMPGGFTAALGLDPKTSWAVGEPCKNRHGLVQPGMRQESYWLHSFGETKDGDLPSCLLHVASGLAVHRDFFHQLSATGGKAQFLVGFFIDAPNSSIPLDAELLAKCSELGLGICIDIYG